MKLLRSLGIWLAVVLASASCGGAGAPAATPDPFAGRYSINGGGGALQIAQPLADAFEKLHPSVKFVLEDIGSDAGVTLAANGSIDLGMTSRDLKESEAALVHSLSIGFSGTGVATNAANPIDSLTKQQVKDIFSGTITDWAAVGGTPGKITVLVREAQSATRSSFESYFFGGKATYSKDAIEIYEIEETIKSIRSFKSSIGMLTVNERTTHEQGIKLLAIDRVAANQQNLANGQYPVRRPLYFVYDPTKTKPAIRAFLDFVRSPDGQKIVVSN